MRASLKFLNESFDRFNLLIFNCRLPRPEMRISSARTFMGQFKAKRRWSGGRCCESLHISVSDRYDIPQSDLEDIIIHEMIHLFIHIDKMKDSSSHGRIFRKLMLEINSRFGRNITISHRCTPAQIESDSGKTHSIMCLCTMSDGRRLMCRVSQGKVFEIHKAFEEWDLVRAQEWFMVYGSGFNRFPRIRSPKLFPVDEEGITLIESGVRLEFEVVSGGTEVVRVAGKIRR